jgi:DNA-binding response OmpR family regulator
MMIFSRRRFVHLAGWGTVLTVLPATAKISSEQPFSRIGDLTINPDTWGITINERVRLTGKEYKLLKFLWLHKGQTISSEVMLKHLYAGVDEPQLKIIDLFISMLRFKIFKATDGRGSLKIDAVADRGYVLRDT